MSMKFHSALLSDHSILEAEEDIHMGTRKAQVLSDSNFSIDPYIH